MVKIDSLDRAIVDLLMQDGRLPCAEIARQVGGGLTERTVRYRLGRLIKDGVVRVSAVVNPQAIGFSVTWSIKGANFCPIFVMLPAISSSSDCCEGVAARSWGAKPLLPRSGTLLKKAKKL